MKEIVARADVGTSPAGRTTITVTLRAGSRYPDEIWFELPPGTTASRIDPERLGDVAAAVGVLPAMLDDLPLRLEQPASRRLLDGLQTYQDVLATWYPAEFSRVPVAAEIREPRPSGGAGTASFFTGGADSLYTFVTRRSEIDAIVYVDGFDVDLSQAEALDAVGRHLEAIDRELGGMLVKLRSNARELLVPFADWGRATHGIALGSASLILGALGFDRVLIPSTNSYDELFPWGSHPVLDPLWSTEETAVIHDGAGAHRGVKVARIADDPLTRGHLRVCWENPSSYNCSRCEKCVRTMAMLHANGRLSDVETFDHSVDLVAAADRPLRAATEAMYARIIARTLRENDVDPALASVYERRLREYENPRPTPLRARARRLAGRVLRRAGLLR